MSSISMEWLGGPIVLNLNQDEIMLDFAEGYLTPTPDSTSSPPAPAAAAPSVTPAHADDAAPDEVDAANEAA